jgi:hypothetical protein
MRCSKCGSDNGEGAKFCDECGAALMAGVIARATGVQTAPTIPASGEGRHLTVLFCDLVGTTEIAAQLDPEE